MSEDLADGDGTPSIGEQAMDDNSTNGSNNNKNWLVNASILGKRSVKPTEIPKDGPYGPTGFEEWGGYMEAKKAKLDVQLNQGVPTVSTIFANDSIHINGYTDPPEHTLRKMFLAHSGSVHPYHSSRTDFVVATNLSAPSKNLYASKTIVPAWITDSIKSNKRLDPRKYMAYDLNRENNQSTLTQMLKKAKVDNVDNQVSSRVDAMDESPSITIGDHSPNEGYSLAESSIGTSKVSTGIPIENNRRSRNANDEGFLEDFFKNSRLHLISEQKKIMQRKVLDFRKSKSHVLDFAEEYKEYCKQSGNIDCDDVTMETSTLMHIDMDCFFVSVGLINRPSLKGKPTIVTHSSGKKDDSSSDIACASYEARKFGIRNGMWVSKAKKLCPEVEVIPYDFEAYKQVSDQFYETVARITLNIVANSVDEMVIDATQLLSETPGSNAYSLAEFIRRKIQERTNCTASVGIGCNPLLAKLALKKAKPNGLFYLKSVDAEAYIADLPISDIPGVGWSLTSKLKEIFGIEKCSDALNVSLAELKNIVGVKTAERIVNCCRGLDPTTLNYDTENPKTISVDVNYGIRFTETDQAIEFMMKLSKEISSRAAAANTKASGLTLKVLVRKKGAGEPLKSGGHGIVDSHSRSARFLQATRDWQVIFSNAQKLMRLLSFPVTDFRGLGLTLTDLVYSDERNKLGGLKQTKQRTLHDLTTSRGKKMLEFATKQRRSLSSNDKDTFSTAPKNNTNNNTSNPLSETRDITIKKQEIDINILKELPYEIAKEMANHYGIDLQPSNDTIPVNNKDEDRKDTKEKSLSPPRNESTDIFGDIEKLDPTFLSALPENIQEEVVAQFQKVRGIERLTENSGIVDLEKPSTSKQAMLIYNAKTGAGNIEQTSTSENQIQKMNKPFVSSAGSVTNEITSETINNQDTNDTESCNTPPSSSFPHTLKQGNASRSTFSQHRYPHQDLTRKKRKRLDFGNVVETCNSEGISNPLPRLNFDDESSSVAIDSDNLSSPCKALEVDASKGPDSKPPMASSVMKCFESRSGITPIIPPITTRITTLNDAYKVDDIRNVLRATITDTTIPTAEDEKILISFTAAMASEARLCQLSTVMRCIIRRIERLPPDSPWVAVLERVMRNTQKLHVKYYGGAIVLD